MKYINLIGIFSNTKNLNSFAKKFFSIVGISIYEERESSNYINGLYFRGVKDSFEYVISISDDEHHSLPFWVQVKSECTDIGKFTDEVDSIVLNKLIPAGFQFFRINNFGKINEKTVSYTYYLPNNAP